LSLAAYAGLLGLSIAATALLSFGYGFLEGPDYPQLSMFGV